MEETIDYAEEYLQLKNKEMWHKAENYVQLEENSLKEKAQFNDFVGFKVKQGRKQEQERIMRIIRDTGYIRNMSKLTLYKKIFSKEKLQKEVDEK